MTLPRSSDSHVTATIASASGNFSSAMCILNTSQSPGSFLYRSTPARERHKERAFEEEQKKLSNREFRVEDSRERAENKERAILFSLVWRLRVRPLVGCGIAAMTEDSLHGTISSVYGSMSITSGTSPALVSALLLSLSLSLSLSRRTRVRVVFLAWCGWDAAKRTLFGERLDHALHEQPLRAAAYSRDSSTTSDALTDAHRDFDTHTHTRTEERLYEEAARATHLRGIGVDDRAILLARPVSLRRNVSLAKTVLAAWPTQGIKETWRREAPWGPS